MVSCNQTNVSNEYINAIEKTDFCRLDSSNNYEVYIPKRISSNKKLPLLVIIDAHGSGKFAIDKFKHGANNYPVILVASNLIKNGYANYERAITTLIEDVREKYPVSEMLFMTGFSGGARMTLGYALNHRLNGLILCGALANADQINKARCPVISISGMDDFNFIETAQYLFKEELIPRNLNIELINASHNWPDSTILTNALGFLFLSSQAGNSPPPAKSEISEYCEDHETRIDTLKKHGDFLKAAMVARNMSQNAPFSSYKTFTSSYKDLKVNSGYINQLNLLRKCLEYEMEARQPYLDAFINRDSLWWQNEIHTLESKMQSENNPYRNDMYKRIKGFLGIACYSLGNKAIKEHNGEMLNKIVPIYRMLEPENPYVLYFSAFPYYWEGNNEATINILNNALKEDFPDVNQLKKDFPESITSKLIDNL